MSCRVTQTLLTQTKETEKKALLKARISQTKLLMTQLGWRLGYLKVKLDTLLIYTVLILETGYFITRNWMHRILSMIYNIFDYVLYETVYFIGFPGLLS